MRPARALLRQPALLLGLGFGSGLAARAPGTVGTLAAIPPYLLLAALPPPLYAAALLLAVLAGVWICAHSARALGVHDHPAIVWDEFVGLWLALWGSGHDPLAIALGFACFRAFDILKPWPISALDRRVPGGLGIMLDDLLAGLAALGCLSALRALSLL